MRRQATVLVAGGIAAVLALALVLPAIAAWRDGTDPQGGQSGDVVDASTERERAGAFLAENGYVSLATGDVMEFSNHFYAQVVDAETGAGALELIVTRDGASVHEAHGPAMHWNAAYSPMDGADCSTMHDAMMEGAGHRMMDGPHEHDGMMDGMRQGMMNDDSAHSQMMAGMGRGTGSHHDYGHANQMQGMMSMGVMMNTCPLDGSGPTDGVTQDEALDADSAAAMVQVWLDVQGTGFTTAGVVEFPGYFTVLTADADGAPSDLVSINALTGQVWDHSWHGSLVGIDRAG